MGLREFLEQYDSVVRISKPVSLHLEAAGVLKALDGQPVVFQNVQGLGFPVVGNLFSSKAAIAAYLGIRPNEIVGRMTSAIDHPRAPTIVDVAPCQEVERENIDLDELPLLFHCAADGGRYISSGVVVAKDERHGQNLDFHRMMQVSKNQLAVRVVAGRHFDQFLQFQGRMPMAVCIGNGAGVMLAAATSLALGRDELEIAAALEPLRVTRARSFDALIPADCEFVLEGTIDLQKTTAEGPFVDLTETYDGVRQQPVFTVEHITHRKDAIWQALLPGGLEHKMLMGMPREPTIFREVLAAGVKCLDVHINPGGCSWLHAIMQIQKQKEEDGKLAALAAFRWHSSLKHAFIVDQDIDIYDPQQVEWALATRFQGDLDLVSIGRSKGSSLDPSAERDTNLTYKLGFDLTRPLAASGKDFCKAPYPRVNLLEYLGDDDLK